MQVVSSLVLALWAPPDCGDWPKAPPPDLGAWVRASLAAGAPRLEDLGGVPGGFQGLLGTRRFALRPAGGKVAAPQLDVDGLSVSLGDPARWPVPVETLDGEVAHLGSPLGPLTVAGAFLTDVTGDGVPDAVLAVSAQGQRKGPADEDSFLALRELSEGNLYEAIVVLDGARPQASTLPLAAFHEHRVTSTDGTDRGRVFTYVCGAPPPLPWKQAFTLRCEAGAEARDALARVLRRVVSATIARFQVTPYGPPFERTPACRRALGSPP